MKKLRVVQIGINYYSHAVQAWNTLIKSDGFEVVGYVLPENERMRYPDKMHMFDGYPELELESVLNDTSIDAVVIETDEVYLTKYALMAARAKKPMHMEKPGGNDVKEFEQLTDTVKKNNVPFHIGYMYRYNPVITDAIARAKSGELGNITNVEIQMNCIHKQYVQDWVSELPGGMMFFLGCHLVDIMLQIQGEPDNITAYSKDRGKNCFALFEYPHGVSFVKTCDTEYGGFDRRQLVITASERTLEIRPLEVLTEGEDIFTEMTEYSSPSWHDRGEHTKTDSFDRYGGMLESFAAIVRGEKQNPFTPDYELTLYKNIIKCCGWDLRVF